MSTPKTTPQASITIDDTTNDSVTILHQSGDTLAENDTRIVVYDEESDTTYTFDAGSTTVQAAIPGPDFETGERATINIGTNDALTDDGTVEVRVIDSSSGGTISQPSATVTY
ncbi:hypothetical protein C9439_02915 [archaeon SCG-AAA382B04]|nr:hypothetical protein C9439_02915 [archaeon SCG-AAA382B04]